MHDNNFKGYLLKTLSGDKWARIGTQKRAGMVVPLFSVFSQKSQGIGDFADLKLIVDLALKTGNSIIQLLPMNEVGGVFCPYDSVSSFALEPAYLSLGKIAYVSGGRFDSRIEALRKQFSLPGRAYVDYGIKKEKIKLLWDIFSESNIDDSPEINDFISDNSYWLSDFALFKALKEHHQGKAWFDWEDKYKNRVPGAIIDFIQTREKEIAFQVWLQLQAFCQFQEAKKYANEHGVLIKGDLPILVSRDSADVWTHQRFFKLECAAGAPPDMYCASGQRWGMPTYEWGEISSDGYRYLKEKLKYAQNFYDIIRVDHVVGLFRIWSIPYNEPQENNGLNGFFDPQDSSIWGNQGRELLSVMLSNTNALLCAEDLGIIPQVCTQTVAQLGIPGNDVQRWMKDWDVRHDFLKSDCYRNLSVAMLSTHDTLNWPGWWENEAGTVDEALFIRMCSSRSIDWAQVRGKLFDLSLSKHGRLRWLNIIDSIDKLADILGKRKDDIWDIIGLYKNTYREKEKLWEHFGFSGPMREKADAQIIKAAFNITLTSGSIFCIETLVDWLMLAGLLEGDSYQYRLNTPGTVSDKNWSLLMPIPLEDLLKHNICGEIKQMIVASGRI